MGKYVGCTILALVLSLCVGTAAVGRPAPASQSAVPGHYAVVNGYRMYYEEYGKGRPLLLLHGGLNTIHSSFEKQIPEFARSYHIIAPEQLGHGHTPDVSRSFTYRQMADDTADLLRQLKIEGADVVGWSDGGILALLLARHHPALVRRLVVSGTNVRVEGMASTKRLREMPGPELAKTLPDAWREAYERLSPDGPDHWPVVVTKAQAMWLTPVTLEHADLAAIRAATLVVSGDRDAITLEHTVEIFRSLPGAQLCILPNTGHPTFQTADKWLNPMMLAFFDAP
jgi:pimeloyl-ACP methyl ester carboxylesterase